MPFDEASYSAGFAGNPEFAPDAYRVGYSSMVTAADGLRLPPGDRRARDAQGAGNPVGLRPGASTAPSG